MLRKSLRISALSEIISATISFAAASASSTLSTPRSGLIYFSASSSGFGQFLSCSYNRSASGSSPFSLAIVARVRRFCLYGRYKSSASDKVFAERMAAFNSSVSFPCSSILLIISSLRSSRFRKYLSLSSNVRSEVSSIAPCASLRYLAINGIVFPSSINAMTFSTARTGFPISSAICFAMFIYSFLLIVFFPFGVFI